MLIFAGSLLQNVCKGRPTRGGPSVFFTLLTPCSLL